MIIGQVRQWGVKCDVDQYGRRTVELVIQARAIAALLVTAAQEVEQAERRDKRAQDKRDRNRSAR